MENFSWNTSGEPNFKIRPICEGGGINFLNITQQLILILVQQKTRGNEIIDVVVADLNQGLVEDEDTMEK